MLLLVSNFIHGRNHHSDSRMHFQVAPVVVVVAAAACSPPFLGIWQDSGLETTRLRATAPVGRVGRARLQAPANASTKGQLRIHHRLRASETRPRLLQIRGIRLADLTYPDSGQMIPI